MPREKNIRGRESNTIEPNKIYIIATEGETEQYYFDALRDNMMQQGKCIEVVLVPKIDNNGNKITESNPRNTFRFLSLYDKEYGIKGNKYKELWLLADRDRWGEQIEEVYIKCMESTYFFALSNPCFELWLLLHKKSISSFSLAEQELMLKNPKVDENWVVKLRAKRRYIEKHLLSICGQFHKTKLKTDDYIPFVMTAIENSKEIHIDVTEKYPLGLGTHVYILAEKIIKA